MEKKYSVFYKYGDEVNDNYLSKEDAMRFAHNLEKDGYEVIVAELNDNDEWETIYETKSTDDRGEMPWDYGKHFD